jgi:hypothetical protein
VSSPLPRALLLAGPFAVLAAGCGRRATPADCRLIVDKSVELQLKMLSETDAPSVARKEQLVRAQMQDELKACEGRLVSDKMMSCVISAPTTEELEQCLR